MCAFLYFLPIITKILLFITIMEMLLLTLVFQSGGYKGAGIKKVWR
jgi:hypothetical protein